MAVYTNVSSDHLDRHGTLEAYRRVKRRLAELVDPDGALVLNAEDPVVAGYAAIGAVPAVLYRRERPMPGGLGVVDGWIVAAGVERLPLAGGGPAATGPGGRIMPVGELAIPGAHNVSNALAAVAVGLLFGVAPDAIREAAASFTGVEHRLEPVALIDGVRFVNDSQGTQPDAVIAALRAFDAADRADRRRPGQGDRSRGARAGRRRAGDRRGADRRERAEPRRQLPRGRAGPNGGRQDLDDAVRRADAIAREALAVRPGGRIAGGPATVLLSPAAASFDMFTDYAARGRAFKAAVAALAARRTARRGPMNLAVSIPRLGRQAGDDLEPIAVERTMVNRTPVKSRAGAVRRERHQADYVILVVVVALTALGILMVYSSSAIKGYLSQDADTFATVGPQIQWAILGMLAMAIMMRVDYRYLRLVSVPLYFVAIVLLVLVFVPQFNIVVGGSARWLKLGPLPAIHPAEIAKLALVIYLAHWLAKRGGRIRGFWSGTVPFLLIVAPIIALVFKEPDLGTTGVITMTVFTMFFVAGRQPRPPRGDGWRRAAGDDRGRPARLPARPDPGLAGPVAGSAGRGLPHRPGAAGAGRRRDPRDRARERARCSSQTPSTTSSSPRSARSSG